MMYPSFRGGNMNPGYIEAFYGEVDDLLASADHLAQKDYVDTQWIYLGGHSTGGTMVMLAAAATDRLRAVFAFGPVDDVTEYSSDVLPFNPWKDQEATLRNPIQWLHARKSPVFVFEGSSGNITFLRSMRRASDNPQLHFHAVHRADHFSILAPMTTLVAEKIQQDTGFTCSIQFTDRELGQRF
ncbi:MAG: peptidase [Planctomycetaceae bacterium]|nr:peptidase [Planctomycetaceae bacterium]